MNRAYIKEMRQLLKTAYNYLKDGKSSGCYYLPLEDDLYLVVTYVPEEGVLAKVAYNCSSLQCDYDIDWNLPEFEDDDCYPVGAVLDGHTFRKTAEYLYAETKAIIRYRKKGLVKDWR